MRRGIAVTWHLVSFLIASVLYFFFVLPRWPELLGDTSHTLGTAVRIATGVLFGFSALPVVFTLLKAQRPEFGTPRLALSLQIWSVIGHVTAALLIIGTAIAEIWLDLDTSGRWLFAVYGAAAGIALLSATAFYLSFAAELPPPPPKPLKPKKVKASALDTAAEDDATDTSSTAPHETTASVDSDTVEDTESAEVTATAAEPESQASEAAATDTVTTSDEDADPVDAPEDVTGPESTAGAATKPARTLLRNRRRHKQSDGVGISEN